MLTIEEFNRINQPYLAIDEANIWFMGRNPLELPKEVVSETHGQLYVYPAADTIKIGFAKDLRARLNEHKNLFIKSAPKGTIFNELFLFTAPHTNAHDNETKLHQHFKQLRQGKTEHFDCDLTFFYDNLQDVGLRYNDLIKMQAVKSVQPITVSKSVSKVSEMPLAIQASIAMDLTLGAEPTDLMKTYNLTDLQYKALVENPDFVKLLAKEKETFRGAEGVFKLKAMAFANNLLEDAFHKAKQPLTTTKDFTALFKLITGFAGYNPESMMQVDGTIGGTGNARQVMHFNFNIEGLEHLRPPPALIIDNAVKVIASNEEDTDL